MIERLKSVKKKHISERKKAVYISFRKRDKKPR